MNRILLVLLLVACLAIPASSQSQMRLCVMTTATTCTPVTAAAPFPVTGTVSPTGTQDTNLVGINSTAPVTGSGTATGALRVELPTNGTGVVALAAGAQLIGQVSVNQSSPGTTNGVTPVPTSSSAAGNANVVSSALEACKVLKASGGNLYNLTATIGATSGWVLIFDATSAPADGAVTPVWFFPITSNGTNGGLGASFNTPRFMGTGITACFSTTGPFTKTASSTAAFSAGVQ